MERSLPRKSSLHTSHLGHLRVVVMALLLAFVPGVTALAQVPVT